MRAVAIKYALELDARITASRREEKYLVTPAMANVLVKEVDQRLEPHTHQRDEPTRDAASSHLVTTIYFDTTSRTLFRAAAACADRNVKLRVKEYDGVASMLWLELKHRDGACTEKRRLAIPKLDACRFFGDGTLTSEMLTAIHDIYGGASRRVLAEIADLCAKTGPMRPACVVNYRRYAWQDHDANLRVTVDSELAAFSAPLDLWTRPTFARETLGVPIATEARTILEIKSHGDPPAWLTHLLDTYRIEPATFSKFEAASSAVHVEQEL